MIVSRLSKLSHLLLAGVLALAFTAAPAADDPLSGQTFTTPGYTPPANPTRGAGQAGAQGAPGTGYVPGTMGRSPQNANAAQRAGQASTDDTGQTLRDFPPPPPSEFQKFVATATGRLLPVFGSPFFREAGRQAPSTDNVPVSGDYTVGPGDEIVLRAWGSIDVDYRSTVDRNGMLNLPKVGSFNVAGVKASELERHLRAQIGRLYTNFNLSVSLGQLRGLRIFVVGPAQRPGVYTLPSQSTMLSALVAAGGPSPTGSMRKVTLRRDNKEISELDVYEFLVQGDKSKDVQLVAGDVVVVSPVGPRVALTGAVETPAIYELKSADEPLRELLRYAGGAPVLANPNKAQLERIDPTQQKARFVDEFRLDATGLAKPLHDGDVVTLLPISPQFANAVTLKGHVAQPLRYAWRPGMRIRDLIPDREALISPDFYRRKNLLVQVIEDDERDDRLRRDYGRSTQNGPSLQNSPYRQPEPSGRTMGDGQQPDASYGPNGADGMQSPNTGNVNASRTRRASDETERLDDRTAVERARKSPAALFDELNWDYAVIERLNASDLKTQVIPFNLGKVVLQGDETNNLELLAGDVVTVYSQKDVRVPVARQTRLVSVEGEVAAPGVYQLQAGETLKGLLARVGGLTPQAYLYGLEFTREETRQRQRENLNQAIARLESLSATQAARDAANRRDDASAASATTVSNLATQAQLSRLRRLEPNGRIALELTPTTVTLEALPDVPLEHGDRVSVPPRPGFVIVTGAVVNSNAFLWRPGRTAGDFLRLAGADESADPSNMFILRADGTVAHANDRRGLFGRNNLESQEMQPGDALVVPNQLDYETWGRALVRNLKDWSQIFSQFGLGIAAINTLK
jgi:protein involved in polysaccharide export with SLBB domain